jgi:sugar lactone lactonase YvrE
MKTHIIITLLFLASLVLGISDSAAAHGSPPQAASAAPAPANQDVDLQALALGPSGTSFRYLSTFGVPGQPYPSDTAHLFAPNGLYIDGGDSLYVVEEMGQRLLKYEASGENTLVVGRAGMARSQEDFLSAPKDVAIYGNGHIWTVNAPFIKEFDQDGFLVRTIPETAPWETGDDDTHFSEPRGIAFDGPAGRMFISDTQNQRIQVYKFSGGNPIYVLTIGVTGEPQNDNTGFNQPAQIDFDQEGRLYVVDRANDRIQRCEKQAGPPETWTCSTFFGMTGVPGNDLTHLSGWAFGIGINRATDDIYLADGVNRRVLKCTTAGVCSLFAGVNGQPGGDNAHLSWPADVAVDSIGNVLISDFGNMRIQEFSSAGAYIKTIGTTGVPYVADKIRLNSPAGVSVAKDGSMFVVENSGNRLIKYNPAGKQVFTVGQAGIGGNNATHFANPQGRPAITASGFIYVADTGNNRVQIFTKTGAFIASKGSPGSGPDNFDNPRDVAIHPLTGDAYVVDRNNQRVQVYQDVPNSPYKATIGTTSVAGSDNTHFRNPGGAAFDAAGNLYVADSGNFRIQKCDVSSLPAYTCSTFAGEAGNSANDFSHFGNPSAVEVDSAGRVYVSDSVFNRLVVLDSGGKYLTAMGGNPDLSSGSLNNPAGIAVDKSGVLYVADMGNHRIQRYALGDPNWLQSNLNGFGDRNNFAVHRMVVFNDMLYAGTYNNNGGQVWRTSDGTTWNQVPLPGYFSANNLSILLGGPFNGYLYAGTANRETGGEIWRCSACDGSDWEQVISVGFDGADNTSIERIFVFKGILYATTSNAKTGAEVWKSPNGDPSWWSQVNVDGFNDSRNTGMWGAAVVKGYLYVATSQLDAYAEGTQSGVEIWRCQACDNTDWSQVNTDGFGNAGNYAAWIESFNGSLYVLTNNDSGVQVWSCSLCGGTDWTRKAVNGFNDPANNSGNFLIAFGNQLYAGVGNHPTGTEIWRTDTGAKWTRVNFDGFGDSNNVETWSGAIFNYRLYLGTHNDIAWRQPATGAEVWKLKAPGYAPILISPVDGTVLLNNRPTFTWKAIAAASKYSIQIGKDPLFKKSVGTYSVTCTGALTCSYTPAADVPVNMTLYWRVKIVLKGFTNPWSDVWSFKTANPPSIPVLVTPKDKALVTGYQPMMTWKPSIFPAGTSFDSYAIQVDNDANFSSTVIDQHNSTGPTFTNFAPGFDLDPNTTYYWHVSTYNTAGEYSSWSPTRSFRTPLPKPISPHADNSDQTLRPTFTWDMPAYPGQHATGFTLQLFKGANYEALYKTLNSTCTILPCSLTLPFNLAPNQDYSWQLRANGLNGPSEWARPAGSFHTGNPPSVPKLLSPADKVTVAAPPSLSWSVSVDPGGSSIRYSVQIANDALFTPPFVDGWSSLTGTNLLVPAEDLLASHKYYWRVKACNLLVQCSTWSAGRWFRFVP